MTLIFEQTKSRNGKPAWKVLRQDEGIDGRLIHQDLGFIYWINTSYRFSPRLYRLAMTAAELRQIADFCEAQK